MRLPFKDASIDVAVLNGVLEWVGAADMEASPEQMQAKALKEIRKSGNFNRYSNELMHEMLTEHIFRDGKAEKRGRL